jgi:ketosteroid isomerase-like protein
MKKLLFIAAIISVIACNQINTEGKELKTEVSNPALDSARAGIEKALAAHITADLKGDALAGAAVFDDAGIMIEDGKPPIIGRAALDSSEVENFKIFKVSELAHTIDGLSLQGDKAFQLGTVKGKFIMNADNFVMDVNSKYMATWKKQKDGSWRIHYFVYYP